MATSLETLVKQNAELNYNDHADTLYKMDAEIDAQMDAEGRALIVISDHDETLTWSHTIDTPGLGVYKETAENPTPEDVIAKKLSINGRHPELIRRIFQGLEKQGRLVAVASFHDGSPLDAEALAAQYKIEDAIVEDGVEVEPAVYSNRIGGPKYIRKSLNISIPGVDWDNMLIVAHKPPFAEQDDHGKNLFIKEIVEEFNKRHPSQALDLNNPVHRRRVVLIEDSNTNCKLARAAGYRVGPTVDRINDMDLNYIIFLYKLARLTVADLEAVRKEVAEGYKGRTYINDLEKAKADELAFIDQIIAIAKTLTASDVKSNVEAAAAAETGSAGPGPAAALVTPLFDQSKLRDNLATVGRAVEATAGVAVGAAAAAGAAAAVAVADTSDASVAASVGAGGDGAASVSDSEEARRAKALFQ